jgi:fucose 4-O-acetylase-like acetyltransferase
MPARTLLEAPLPASSPAASLSASPPGAPPEPRPRPDRDPWFDNAKILLVVLVVVGHSWTLLPDVAAYDRLYDWLYLWHVPAFVLVTGYLSRTFTWSRRHLRRLVTTVLLPYLVFEGLLALFRVHVGGESFEQLWLNPHWPMWYLAALVVWRLATPLLRRLRHPLATAVVVSLAGGVIGTELFDLNRALGLLPFFVLGLLVEPRHLDTLRTPRARSAGLAVLVAGVVPALLVPRIGTEWLYYRTSYAGLGVSWWEGAALRAGLIAVAVAMAAAVFAWVPRRASWYTRLGASTLVVYLFHGFAVKGAEYAGVAGWASDHPVLALPVVTAAAVVVGLVLAWRPVARPLAKVVHPAP